jgi:hypothetical protein
MSSSSTPVESRAVNSLAPPVDVLLPAESFLNPAHLVEQFLRGFCHPLQQPTEATTAAAAVNRSADSLHHEDVPSMIQATQSSCSVSEESCLVDFDDDDESEYPNTSARAATPSHTNPNGNDDNDDDDDDRNASTDWVLVETVSGTSRCVRVGKGLEIFACTILVMVVTVLALKRCAHVDFFEWHAKLRFDEL